MLETIKDRNVKTLLEAKVDTLLGEVSSNLEVAESGKRHKRVRRLGKVIFGDTDEIGFQVSGKEVIKLSHAKSILELCQSVAEKAHRESHPTDADSESETLSLSYKTSKGAERGLSIGSVEDKIVIGILETEGQADTISTTYLVDADGIKKLEPFNELDGKRVHEDTLMNGTEFLRMTSDYDTSPVGYEEFNQLSDTISSFTHGEMTGVLFDNPNDSNRYL